MKKYKLGSNWVNCVSSVRVIFAGSGQFDLTTLDFLVVVLQLVVVGEQTDSKVGVNAHLGVNKRLAKLENEEEKSFSHRHPKRQQHGETKTEGWRTMPTMPEKTKATRWTM